MSEGKTIVEINGVKLEVDLRHATIIHDNLKIGSKVKLLKKSTYSAPTVLAGVIVGFDMFPTMPTITVAYIETDYGNNSPVKFAAINEKSAESFEMVPSVDDDLPISKDTVLKQIDRAIESKKAELQTLEMQRTYFLSMFGVYFDRFTKIEVES